ncbi:hypothetical protein OIO90_005189 [Microbotryomycetes sp. JL221]|nr:hypothetical protein OIO90_005189 [Microbotryomycetes sp. JL221]
MQTTLLSQNDFQAMQWASSADFVGGKWSQPRGGPSELDDVEELSLPQLPSPPIDFDTSNGIYLQDAYGYSSSCASSPATSFYQTPVGSASHLSLPSTPQTTSMTPLLSQTSFDDNVEYDVETFYTQRTQAPTPDQLPRRSTLPELSSSFESGVVSFAPTAAQVYARRGSAPQLLPSEVYLNVSSSSPYNASPLPSPSLSDSGVNASYMPSNSFDEYGFVDTQPQYTTTAVAAPLGPPLELASSPSSYRPRLNSAPALQGQIPSSVHTVTVGNHRSPAPPHYLAPSPRIVYDESNLIAPSSPLSPNGARASPNPSAHGLMLSPASPAILRRSSSNPGVQYTGSPYRLASHPYSPGTPRSFHGFEPSPEFYNGPSPMSAPPLSVAKAESTHLASPPPSPAARQPLNGGKNRLKFVNFSSSSAEDRVKLLARSSGVKGKKRAAALAAKLAAQSG